MQLCRSPIEARTDLPERIAEGASGLRIEATTQSRSEILKAFYEGYDEAFVLPNEKEEYEGFVRCLDLNRGEAYTRLSDLYGAFREIVLVARDPANGALVAGANLIAFPLMCDRTVLSINLNYIFTSPAHRRQGHFRKLVTALGDVASAFFETGGAHLAPLIFIEQNDPFQMSAADYARDTQHSGIDQMTRIRLWAALGAKIIDFPYVQPPLSADQGADTSLLYAVVGADGGSLDACLLHVHLARFFGISVLKGSDPKADATAGPQLAALADRCRNGVTIPLLTASRLPSLIPDELGGADRTSLRKLIRAIA